MADPEQPTRLAFEARARDRFFEVSPDMLCIADFHGRLRQVNPKFASVLGYSIAELEELNYFTLPHPDDLPLIMTKLQELGVGKAVAQVEFRVRRADGHYLWTDWHAHADIDHGLIFAVARDITASRKLQEQLRQSQRMDAIGQLAGGIAHDFNNLLQAMLANAYFIRRAAGDRHLIHSHAQDIVEAATRAAKLTRQLLTFARRQPLQRELLSLDTVARDMLAMLRRLLPATIELELVTGDELGLVSADRAQLEQVVVNLCVNARDAMPDGGRLAVETGVVVVNGNFPRMHPWATPGRHVVLTVTDNGCGMDDDTRERIFEPFFTTKAAGAGTGLGLSTVYGIVQQHGGFVHVYSELGKGTTFKIYLPASAQDAAAVEPRVDAEVTGGSETILVAEDEDLVRNTLHELLTRFGYRVLLARDGAEALSLFTVHKDDINLAILDVVMPRVGGAAAATAMRTVAPDVRILFCSGYADPHTLDEESLDLTKLVQKPIDPDSLLRRIRDELDRPGDPKS